MDRPPGRRVDRLQENRGRPSRGPGATARGRHSPRSVRRRFHHESPKKDQLTALCDAVLGAFPALGGDDGVRRLIDRLPAV